MGYAYYEYTPTCNTHVIPPTPINILHPDTGVPQINFNQFIHLSHIHQDILHDTSFSSHIETDNPIQITVHKVAKNIFTRLQLKKRSDWKDWEQSEFLQLDQYLRRNMFGAPGPIPPHASHDLGIFNQSWWSRVSEMRRQRCSSFQRHHHSCTHPCCLYWPICLQLILGDCGRQVQIILFWINFESIPVGNIGITDEQDIGDPFEFNIQKVIISPTFSATSNHWPSCFTFWASSQCHAQL